ncbi:MAG: Uncharacterised protein [Flavobacteriales bacterium]|jgi:hypothetical protein|nr:MAG: DUF1573 domain-containing protein [Flavobacteriales bacterium]CAI8291055.1 MAG: Uncharacterised protein [Flavobacteriales bacterium]|tara:strand:+ start:2314 stop:2697 length:384 start_codon:yes stop_codon:yes gene_type:complete
MKKIFLSVFFVGLGFTAVAQEVATITFDSLIVDYGTINKGEDGVRQFKFTNTGTADLEITQVRSSCGCTIPKKPSGPIAPGASDVIEVKYDTERIGPIRKTITVASNASNGMVALKIKGEVQEPIEE